MSEIQKYRLLRASTHEGISISLLEHDDGDLCKSEDVEPAITTLETELSAARGEIERLKKRVEELADRIRVSMPYSCDRR